MKLIFVCSPYRGNIEHNTSRAQSYCRFVQTQGHTPFAPHLFFTQFLDESISEEREEGIRLGIEMLKRCDELYCFGNRLTDGMRAELRIAIENNIPIKYFNDGCEEVIANESMA